ncbi:MAG: GrdX family protein [Clostridia bacterium]
MIKLKNSVNVLTNNDLIREKYSENLDITFIAGQYIDVLKSARDMVHKGSRLITHPLMGSIKPNETLFRSIIMSKGTELDIESLTIIESSIATTEKFQSDNKVPFWNENVLNDFRFVDLKLFESALESIVK